MNLIMMKLQWTVALIGAPNLVAMAIAWVAEEEASTTETREIATGIKIIAICVACGCAAILLLATLVRVWL